MSSTALVPYVAPLPESLARDAAIVMDGFRRSSPERDPDARRVPWRGRTQAGIFVNADTALTHDVVWACVRYLTQTVAKLPWHVFRDDGGVGEPQRRHPVDFLLHRRPNPEWSSFQLRETLLAWALVRGNGYAEIERDALGRPAWLWPIHPSRVEVDRDEDGRLIYRIDNEDGSGIILPAADVFHLRGLGDGPVGIDIVSYAAQSIGWAQATALFGASFFGEGMNPSGIVQMKSGLDAAGKELLQAELDSLYKGPRRSNRVAILDAGMEWKPITVDADKAQFIGTLQHQVDVICRWFGVPPHKVMHLLRATFSNIEHQSIEVATDSIAPWAKRFEDEADWKLFGQNRSNLYTKINLNALMRGDAKSRSEVLSAMRNGGALNADEWRALEDMAPIGKAKGGELYVMQGQYQTLEQIKDKKDVPPPPALPTPAPADPGETEEDVPAATADRIARLQARLLDLSTHHA